MEISACIFELSFLGAFANLQKATISFVMSVRSPASPPASPLASPLARMEQLAFHAMNFHEI
jgi:hypothetical protein